MDGDTGVLALQGAGEGGPPVVRSQALFSRDVFSELRAQGVHATAAQLGLQSMPKRSIGPCPACGADLRSTSDKTERRGPIGTTENDEGWHCFKCGAEGNAVDLASYALLGRKAVGTEDKAQLAKAIGQRVGYVPSVRPVRTPEPPKRPPQRDVDELWTACRPVTSDDDVSTWLRSRGIDPEAVAASDLARALPYSTTVPDADEWEAGRDPADPMRNGGELPAWCSYIGQTWADSSHRLVLPLFDRSGRMVSLRARALNPPTPKDKAAVPAGYEVKSTVMACAIGSRLLQGDESSRNHVRSHGLWVIEGEPDFLTLATWTDWKQPEPPAALGIMSGGWSAEIAAKVPTGSKVVIATHQDENGDRYFQQIANTLTGRVKVQRRKRSSAEAKVA
jgi:hypothetical protein